MKRGHRDVAEGNQTLGIVSPWNVITLQRLLHQRQGSPSRASVSSDVTRDRFSGGSEPEITSTRKAVQE